MLFRKLILKTNAQVLIYMKISVFGNPDLAFDNVPLKILPRLRERFPHVEFVVEDPNELDLPSEETKEWLVIDTVEGLPGVREVPLEKLIASPRVSAHDFDLGSYLALIHKIRPDLQVRIFGIPMGGEEERIIDELTEILRKTSNPN